MSRSVLKTSKAFKAVILAHEKLNSLYPFHESPSPGLIPVLTKPILEYQFELLERSGFDHCIVICRPVDSKLIKEFADTFCQKTNTSFTVRVVQASDDDDDVNDDGSESGLFYKLTHTKPKISLDCDFLVMPSDFICSESLTKLLAYHHHKRATMTMMLSPPPPQEQLPVQEKDSKGKKPAQPAGKKGQQTSNALTDPRLEPAENPLYVGIDSDNGRVCVLREVDPDVDFQIHKDILHQVKSFTLHTNLRSPSVYVFAPETLELLQNYPKISNFDVLAQFLVGMQYVKDRNPSESSSNISDIGYSYKQPSFNGTSQSTRKTTTFADGQDSDDDVSSVDCIASSHNPDDVGSTTAATTYKTALGGEKETAIFPIEDPTCFAFIPPPASLALRVDSIPTYTFLNKKLSQDAESLPQEWLSLNRPANNLQGIVEELTRQARNAVQEAPPTPTPEPETKGKGKGAAKGPKGPQQPRVIGGWFADVTIIESGATVINSIIGRHCRIEKDAVVKDSVLMGYNTIRGGAKVESCIVGPNASIEAGVQLKDTEVTGDHH